MQTLKALTRVAITALALGLSVSTPSYARQDEASRLNQKVARSVSLAAGKFG